MATPDRLAVKQGRKFAFTLGIALLVLAGLSFWRGHDIVPWLLAAPGGLLLLAGSLIPGRLGPLERQWMAFGHLLSRFMSPIMLGVVYFGVLTPVGMLMRLFGKKPLTDHHQKETTWKIRERRRQSDLTRQF
ncbi:MAG: SxtJ family membrane protein [Rhizobiaceae bacterium]|nr:SxtJ family membrane protein [Rhizobiaceae bacterium]